MRILIKIQSEDGRWMRLRMGWGRGWGYADEVIEYVNVVICSCIRLVSSVDVVA